MRTTNVNDYYSAVKELNRVKKINAKLLEAFDIPQSDLKEARDALQNLDRCTKTTMIGEFSFEAVETLTKLLEAVCDDQ